MKSMLLICALIGISIVTAAESNVKVLTSATFERSIKSGLVMVKFFAPWCGHCKTLKPEYEKAAGQLKNHATMAEVDCTTEQSVCTGQNIRGYPTIKVFNNGRVSEYQSARKAEALVAHMNKLSSESSGGDFPEFAGSENKLAGILQKIAAATSSMDSAAKSFSFGSNPALLATAAAVLLVIMIASGLRKSKRLIDKIEWSKFKLVSKTVINHNTASYRFELQQKSRSLGLPIGQHISVRANIDGKEVMRSYTPTSLSTDLGYFDLVIKSYPTGLLSKHFATLKVGDYIEVRGPKGNFSYTPNMCRSIGMIAGGTGITPMLQIIRAVLSNPNDNTELSLIFANVNEEDILLKKELDVLAKNHSNFKVYYVLNNPPKDWQGGVGFVSKDMITKHFPAPASDIKVLICGPPPMVKAMQSICEEIGYEKARPVSKLEDQVFKF